MLEKVEIMQKLGSVRVSLMKLEDSGNCIPHACQITVSLLYLLFSFLYPFQICTNVNNFLIEENMIKWLISSTIIVFLDIIHHLVFFNNISETGVCFRPQVGAYSVGPN